MSMHTHHWVVTGYTLLGLPTTEGSSERLTSWRCTACGLPCDITGAVQHGYPLETPPFWDRLIARQPAWSVPPPRRAWRCDA